MLNRSLPGSTRSGEKARLKSCPATSPDSSSDGTRCSRVVPGNVVDRLRERDRQRKADVAESDDADAHAPQGSGRPGPTYDLQVVVRAPMNRIGGGGGRKDVIAPRNKGHGCSPVGGTGAAWRAVMTSHG